MHNLKELQIALWRASCRHIGVAESIPDLMGAVANFVPAEAMWIFAAEGDRCTLLAAVLPGGAGAAPFSVRGEDAASVARFVSKGGLCLFQPERTGRSLLRPLSGAFGPGPVICGALQRAGESEGVVAWRLARGAELDDRTAMYLAGTLEPIAAALETSRRFHELEGLRRAAEADRQSALRRLGRDSLESVIVGEHGGLRSVMERAAVVAASDVPVLILGETGSGKEVVARVIHDRSGRHDGPFLRVNCGAIPTELVDSQLFGHERGAFTGATDRRLGWFERADGGTLFLDEIGELPLAAQVRLLRVVQEGTLERVGGDASISVDCRIVAATHRDLAMMVRERAFREDLWYRLAVFPLVIPPLRERPGDLRELAEHFARRAAVRFGLPPFDISEDDVAQLAGYPWPGNVRELGAVIDRAALLAQGHRLALGAALGAATDAQPATGRVAPTRGSGGAIAPLAEAIRAHVEAALERSRGRIEGPGGAAAMLRINPHTLRSKMRKLGVDWTRFRTT